MSLITFLSLFLLVVGMWFYQQGRTKRLNVSLGWDENQLNHNQVTKNFPLFSLLSLLLLILFIYFTLTSKSISENALLNLAINGIAGITVLGGNAIYYIRRKQVKELETTMRQLERDIKAIKWKPVIENIINPDNRGQLPIETEILQLKKIESLRDFAELNTPLHEVGSASSSSSTVNNSPGVALSILRYVGEATYPREMHFGRSEIIKVILKRNLSTNPKRERYIVFKPTDSGHKVAVQAKTNTTDKVFLDVQLKLSGLDQLETNPQRCLWGEDVLTYRWNYEPPKEAIDRKMEMVFKLVTEQKSIELGSIEDNVKIKRLDHLNYTGIMIFAGILLFVGAVGTAISGAKDMRDLLTPSSATQQATEVPPGATPEVTP